ELLAHGIGRPLTGQEKPWAGVLGDAVQGLPLPLIKAAARVKDDGLSLEHVAREAGVAPAGAPGQDRVASVLEAAGAPVEVGLLEAAAVVPDASVLPGLEE